MTSTIAPEVAQSAVATEVTRSALPTVSPQRAWQAARLPVAVGALVIVVGTILALLHGGVRGGLLDPEAARPPGAQALATLLRDRGVDVRRVVKPQRTSGATTFVPIAALLPSDVEADDLLPTADRDVVIVAPGEDLLELLRERSGLDLRVVGEADVADRRPRCLLPAARTAGVALTGGQLYRATSAADTDRCYPAGGRASLVAVEWAGGHLVLVGAPDLFENAHLDEEGNAALALSLLSRRDVVEWVYPRADERPAVNAEPTSVIDLLPDRLVLAAVQLGLACCWLGLWRARRLGPVVPESLPVVVRAAESVEGRAGLYRAGRAHARAASALQDSARRRLAHLLGLGVAPDRSALVAAVAARARRAQPDVDDLLYGRTTADDAALVRLAHDLDTLDSEVRTL